MIRVDFEKEEIKGARDIKEYEQVCITSSKLKKTMPPVTG